jgi:hypothetical protein
MTTMEMGSSAGRTFNNLVDRIQHPLRQLHQQPGLQVDERLLAVGLKGTNDDDDMELKIKDEERLRIM